MIFRSPQEALAFYGAAINRHRFDDLLPVLSPDVVFWFSSGSHRGVNAARLAFEAVWKRVVDETYAIDDVEWIVQNDRSAVCLYRFSWRGFVDGVPAEGGGRGTTALCNVEGTWVIVHEHLSTEPSS